jgi:hypothetical protein
MPSSTVWAIAVCWIVSLATVVAGYTLMPEARLEHAVEKVGNAIAWVAADPIGAAGAIAVAVGTIALFVVTGMGLLGMQPPTWLVRMSDAAKSLRTDTRGNAAVDVVLIGFALLTSLWFAARAWFPALLLSIGLAGCGASALAVNATLADGAGRVVDEACGEVQSARDMEQRHAVDAYASREEASAAVAAVRDRWDPYVFGCRLLADAQNAWADVLVGLVANGGEFSLALVLPEMSRFARTYDDFVALDPPLPDGLHLPTIDPSIVAALETLAPTEGAE